IVNTGGSVANLVDNVSITLAPGFTYVTTTFGPSPAVSGNVLTWIGGLGNVPGGAKAVTIQLAVASSVSSTVGAKQFGTFQATCGDVYDEKLTADLCREIQVTPAPAPKLTKTPSTQGPFSTGDAVTWTLSYGNGGSAASLNSLIQDNLPVGFSYVSSTST